MPYGRITPPNFDSGVNEPKDGGCEVKGKSLDGLSLDPVGSATDVSKPADFNASGTGTRATATTDKKSLPPPEVNYEIMKRCKVRSPFGEMVDFYDSLMKGNIVLLHLIRRYGCGICRDQCREISMLKPALDMLGIKLIGIGHGEKGLGAFVEGHYWDSDLYTDPNGELFHSLGCGREGSPWSVLSPSNVVAILRASSVGDTSVEGGGSRFVLAGSFVFNRYGKAVLEVRQKSFSDSTSLWRLMQACKAALTMDANARSGNGMGSNGTHRLNMFPGPLMKALPEAAWKQPYKDQSEPACEHCGALFTLLKWRYNCNRCGELVCAACCKNKALLPWRQEDGLVAVCLSCVNEGVV
jgi:prostamide/prostaglandin F2alpha synthase